MTQNAEQLRTEARASLQEAHDSFERCDTDGFLSQWASGLNAQLKNRQAAIVEAGGTDTFIGLYQGDRRIPARMIETQYGWTWLLRDEADIAAFGRKFIPEGENSRIQRKLGLCERKERAPAWAKFEGRGTGLSGQCWVISFRTGCKWGTDATAA